MSLWFVSRCFRILSAVRMRLVMSSGISLLKPFALMTVVTFFPVASLTSGTANWSLSIIPISLELFSFFASSMICPSISRGLRALHSGCFDRSGRVDPALPFLRACIRAIF